MAYNNLDASSTPSNVGQRIAPKEDLGRVIKIILTPKDFQFATQTLAETESEYQDAFEQVSDRIFCLPFIVNNEDQSEDMMREEFPGGVSLVVREGNVAEMLYMHLSVADYRKLRTFNNKSFRAIEIDDKGNIRGTSPDNTVFKGFEVTEFYVGKLQRSAGDIVPKVPVFIKYREPSELSDYLTVLRPLKLDTAWDPRDLDGLIDVELTVNTATATNINVTATAYLKGEPLAGFDQVADWILTTSQTITGVTDNGDGTYDLAGVGLVTGTINLAASADLSMDGYESTGAKAVTI
jgi:hypothetical protein